ncbi:MAG: family N-acetyltransferase [Firmicutes bacterium]|nr:family N-acetyltransferase [Bacillota bacterium]
MSLAMRPLTTVDDHKELEAAQRAIWGDGAAIVYDQTLAACKYGGIALGARDGAGRLVGFCYGWPAYDGQQVWLHSHLLGVLPAYRGRGLGETLKREQAKVARAQGYRRMTWTYDPLEAPNARLNLGKLGATARIYEVDYYGSLDDELNRGLPTDRLLVDWNLAAAEGGRVPADDAPVINPADEWTPALSAPVLRLRLPADFRSLHGAGRFDEVLGWRLLVRDALQHYLGRAYILVGFTDGYYVLSVGR